MIIIWNLIGQQWKSPQIFDRKKKMDIIEMTICRFIFYLTTLMKKLLYFTVLLFAWLFLYSSQTFASSSFWPDRVESFTRIDGVEYCAKASEQEAKPCPEFNEEPFNVIWEKIVTIDNKTICISLWREQIDMKECAWLTWSLNTVSTNRESTSKSTCIVNGKEVDCAVMADDIWIFFGNILQYGLILGVIGLLSTIFYIWMLVHAISKPIPNKVVWILVIFFLSPIGMIVYYFAIKRKFIEWGVTTNTPPQTVPYAVNVGVTYNEWPITTTPPVQTEQVVQPSPSEPQIVLTNENNTPTPTV